MSTRVDRALAASMITHTTRVVRLAVLVHLLLGASGCYTWRTVREPRATQRPLASEARVTRSDSLRVTVFGGSLTAAGVAFGEGYLIPWDSVARVEERKISVKRIVGLTLVSYVVMAGVMGYIISGPGAIGLSATH